MDETQKPDLEDEEGCSWYLLRCSDCHRALHLATRELGEVQDMRNMRHACLSCMRLKAIEVSANLGPFGFVRAESK